MNSSKLIPTNLVHSLAYFLCMHIIHITFTNDKWIITSAAIIFTYLYTTIFQIINDNEPQIIEFQKIIIYIMFAATYVILTCMAYYNDLQKKLNFCVVN